MQEVPLSERNQGRAFRIISIIASALGVNITQVTREKRFFEDFHTDWFDTESIFDDVEEDLSISLNNEETEDIVTVGDLIDLVNTKIEKRVT